MGLKMLQASKTKQKPFFQRLLTFFKKGGFFVTFRWLVCLFGDLVNKDISKELIGEYLEKSNLSVQASSGWVNHGRVS